MQWTPRVSSRIPMQVRFFRDRDLEALQATLNDWLAERTDREIAEVRQSLAPGAEPGEGEVVVSVWYLEG